MDTGLKGPDRIGTLIVGGGMIAYALLGGIEEAWLRIGLVLLGAAFLTGGVCGT